jgi:hypothetical protein
MRLVRLGNVVVNMDHLLAIDDRGGRLVVMFACASSSKPLAIVLDQDDCHVLRAWLQRVGVNNLLRETPSFDWGY